MAVTLTNAAPTIQKDIEALVGGGTKLYSILAALDARITEIASKAQAAGGALLSIPASVDFNVAETDTVDTPTTINIGAGAEGAFLIADGIFAAWDDSGEDDSLIITDSTAAVADIYIDPATGDLYSSGFTGYLRTSRGRAIPVTGVEDPGGLGYALLLWDGDASAVTFEGEAEGAGVAIATSEVYSFAVEVAS